MADQTKQSILSGQGNTQIIGVPYEEFIAEIRRRDAEIMRLTTELTAALKNTSDPQEQDDLQSRLDALRQKRDALQNGCWIPIARFGNICSGARNWPKSWRIRHNDTPLVKTASIVRCRPLKVSALMR